MTDEEIEKEVKDIELLRAHGTSIVSMCDERLKKLLRERSIDSKDAANQKNTALMARQLAKRVALLKRQGATFR